MRISFNWLKKYIDIKTTPEEVAETLTSIGLEVESIEYLGKKFEGFVIGEVLQKEKHPNADRLSVCLVRVEKNKSGQQIVCGAPNVAVGQMVIVGLPGAVVPQNQHDPNAKPFTLSKTAIRGIESNGMICSEFELGLGEDKNGIKVLEPTAKVGTTLASYLGLDDVAFEIGVTPNRPDCLSHIGIARDLCAVYKKKILSPSIKIPKNKNLSIDKQLTVKVINKKDCPRYSARMIKRATVKESPDWLKNYLTAAGLRPINNVVDVTNFVMLEYGQPLHAFDYKNISKQVIVVKNTNAGEKFSTLDGKEHTLDGSELMICDGRGPIAIAGVMGGLNSEISSGTTTIVLESAYFNPISVRRTSKKLGISTDASYRFERGTDPHNVIEASARAAKLIAELTGGYVVQGVTDVYDTPIEPLKIMLRCDRVNKILGSNIPSRKIKSILSSIGLTVKNGKNKETFNCVVPTFRPDIEKEIDLIEEVARLYGYDNISNQTSVSVVFNHPDIIEKRINAMRSWFEANGFNEIMTNSLIGKEISSAISDATVNVKNPLSVDHETLRPSLLPTMLQSVAYNYNHGAEKLTFFEIGSIFKKVEDGIPAKYVDGFYEQNTLGICLAGQASPLSWAEKQRSVDIYDIKGIVQSLLSQLGLDNIHLICYDAPSSLTELTLTVEINGSYVGFVGKVRQSILDRFKIEKDVFFSEINLDVLMSFDSARKFTGFSKFPTVTRDVAFIVEDEVQVSKIENVIRNSGGALITSITVFDVFSGKNLGEGKKSLAFSLQLNSSEKTLNDAEIEKIIQRVIQSVTSTFEATLRSI